MRIGVMLRHLDQHNGGVKVYTQRLLNALLERKDGHEYVFFYRDAKLLGTYAKHDRVEEVVARAPSTLLWDQVAVPLAVRRAGIDVLFNPKYSMSLAVSCPTVWVCHGLDWYVMPWASRWIDRLSHKYLVPRYATKADVMIAVSETTRQHVLQYLPIPAARVHTVYLGLEQAYRAEAKPETLAAVRRKFNLPERFILYSGALYPPKNFRRLVQAYAQVGPQAGIPLVVAGGENRFLSEGEAKTPEQLGIEQWVHRPGWIGQDDLPSVYQLATALLMPSLYEACPLPILEAMGSGCPIVTADRYGTAEIAGNAALLVDPYDVDGIAAGLRRVINEPVLREHLAARGRVRARDFTWARCAGQTVATLEFARREPRRERRLERRQEPAVA